MVSVLLLGSVVGALFGGFATDKYGRRAMILRTDVTFIVGSLGIALAPTFPLLLLGRFIVGVGVSVSAIADVAYLTEVPLHLAPWPCLPSLLRPSRSCRQGAAAG